MIHMRKYYLFVIQNEYYKLYVKNPFLLYKILENLYLLDQYDYPYGISVYKQLCQPFSVRLLNNYVQGKYKCSHIGLKVLEIQSLTQKTWIQIGYASTIIFTNQELPDILKVFNIYNRKIFVCDFDHHTFFWLNHRLHKKSQKIG